MKASVLILWFLIFVSVGSIVNAQTWTSFGNGLNYPVNSICYFDNAYFAASGGVYAWNGSNWIDKSSGMLALMDVYTFGIFNSNLFAGGFFTVLTPENNWYNNAARYNNGSWTTCGSGLGNDGIGMSDYVNAMITYNGQLYAGGRFGSAGGSPLYPQETPYIASFDGSLWHSVGGGMDFTVTDLCLYNGDLIASGYFVEAGGVSANRIAKWNGSAWSALGSGMDGKVTALSVYNGELYAGGLFDNAGGSAMQSIAKWNGQSWSPVGGGIYGGGQVYTMAVYNGELYAGGTFVSGAGNAGDYIMKWNGTEWKNVGAGTDGPVIFLYPNGSDLIIGGQFTMAGGISAHNIVAYKNITGVNGEGNLPGEFALNQNYPNPFNPVTTIRYQVPFDSKISLKIYDVLGNLINTLCEGEKPAGSYEISWDGSSLPGGIYFCSFESGSFKDVKKIVLLK